MGRIALQQLLSVWNGLEPRRRIIVIAATLIVFVGVIALGRIAAKPGMALLYAGMEGSAAGDVVQALEQRGVPYEVRGDAIYVPKRRRDETRMALAGEGLPASGIVGYELLDGMSGFGTTSQMFDAAYRRAKEGELSRTIVSSPSIRAARVHIAQGDQQPFRQARTPTASVTVTPAAGGLTAERARALRFMVASAVAGLDPEDVTVIDGNRGTVLAAQDEGAGPGGTGDRAGEMRRAVERLLEAHLGPDRAIVEVNLTPVTERESIVERSIDPDSRVAVESETSETSSASSGPGAQGVTVASNLPEGDGAEDGGESSSQNAETRERMRFDISETQRELLRAPGGIERLTVAVLVDGITEPGDDGATQWRPRTAAELDELRELVASAVGYNDSRGDVITLKSMRLEPVEPAGTQAHSGGLMDRLQLEVMTLVQLAIIALVLLALILFVLRPVLLASRREGNASGSAPAALPVGDPMDGTPASMPDSSALDGAIGAPPLGTLPAIANFDATGARPDGDPTQSDGSDPVERLRRLIESRQEETVEILRNWMEDDEEERA